MTTLAPITCPQCSRPAAILLTVSGRRGTTEMCFACWRPAPAALARQQRGKKR